MKNLLNIILLTTAFTLIKPGVSAMAGAFYVVIGTFSSEDGAREFSRSLDGVFEHASFSFDPGRKLYYVHVLETNQQREAENFRNYLRNDFGFRDAWIYANINAGPETGDGTNDGYVTLELFTGGSVLLSSADNSYVSISKHRDKSKENKEIAAEKSFMFIAETRLGTVIPAKISLLDKKGNVISAFKTGEAVAVGGKQQTQLLTLVCEVPGFHSVTKIIELANPATTLDIHQNTEGIWEVRFTLPRLKADEVALVYDHMFYSDAAILEPAARKNIDLLVSVLKGNPATRIVINSHCNAGEKRTIKLAARGQDYFDLDEAVEKSGSDKQLTRERAEILRDYLVEQGIESHRVSIFGWGSMNLLVNPAADNKSINDRVEVQLLSGQ